MQMTTSLRATPLSFADAQRSLRFYEEQAACYYAQTVSVNLELIHTEFLQHIPAGGRILDAGCGSGRDALAFQQRGYRVQAFDASEALVKLAQENLGDAVSCQRFESFHSAICFDGLWCCASLIHQPQNDWLSALIHLLGYVNPGGVGYLSFKYGTGSLHHPFRSELLLTESELNQRLASRTDVALIKCWRTVENRTGRDLCWLNALVRKVA